MQDAISSCMAVAATASSSHAPSAAYTASSGVVGDSLGTGASSPAAHPARIRSATRAATGAHRVSLLARDATVRAILRR